MDIFEGHYSASHNFPFSVVGRTGKGDGAGGIELQSL